MSQGLIALILFGSLIILFLLKIPIAFSLILSSLFVMLLTGTGLEMIPKRLFTSCDSFSFMAVPFFLLAGSLMSQGGISERLCTFINSVFGRFPGGLGIVAIIACAFFAAMALYLYQQCFRSLSRRSGNCRHHRLRVLCGDLRLRRSHHGGHRRHDDPRDGQARL